VGVKKILRLEAELAEARARLAATLDQARSNLEEAHRQHRRDSSRFKNTIAEFFEAGGEFARARNGSPHGRMGRHDRVNVAS